MNQNKPLTEEQKAIISRVSIGRPSIADVLASIESGEIEKKTGRKPYKMDTSVKFNAEEDAILIWMCLQKGSAYPVYNRLRHIQKKLKKTFKMEVENYNW